MIELLETEIISPETAFVWGCDYRIPLMHGLLDKVYLNELKMSATYKEDSFAREYYGVWTGGAEGAYFDYDKLSSHRSLCNPESSRKVEVKDNVFYLLSVDVGRLSCQTVVTIFKVFRRANEFYISLVNVIVLGKTPQEKHFSIQAIDLKKIIERFRPLEVVIDGNGLGVGLLDYMVKPSFDDKGNFYPGYGSMNDEDYKKIQDKDSEQLLYIIKANASLNNKIHGNCFTKINSGHVKFLIKEQLAKNKLLATQKGMKMRPEERIARLMPHEMTTRLFDEMSNLRLKPTGNGLDINLEEINRKVGKDKFSSLEYGLWRIKEIEEEYYKKQRRKMKGKRNLTFYTQGG